jgi:molybdate/tungstate transport system substrate-binding protein
LLAACGGDAGTRRTGGAGAGETIVVFNAGSLALPLRAALDTFAARDGVIVQQEHAGSLETARKLTELAKIPDVVGLADHEVFSQLLIPDHTTWYAMFARNRMVIAYTDRSRAASEIDADNWWRILQRPGIEVGRSDPDLDPAGYRTLLVMQLAERHYRQPGLAKALLDASPSRNVRPKEADLVALLQAGEFDYAYQYESIAQGTGLRYVTLPTAIDLSTPAESLSYRQASVRVRGATPRDTITFRGEPIVYGVSVPAAAPHRELGERFVAFLLSPDGQRVLRATGLDALPTPVFVGTGVPATVRNAAPSPDTTVPRPASGSAKRAAASP